jgi:type III secretion system FlhB-like substrate exporter
MERSAQRMMQAVPKATVVVTNPTHYAVALRYEPATRPPRSAWPRGVDAMALKIREIAASTACPIIEDVPLARALYAAVDVDDTIPRQHFEAVAKIIGFILGGRSREPGQRPGTTSGNLMFDSQTLGREGTTCRRTHPREATLRLRSGAASTPSAPPPRRFLRHGHPGGGLSRLQGGPTTGPACCSCWAWRA